MKTLPPHVLDALQGLPAGVRPTDLDPAAKKAMEANQRYERLRRAYRNNNPDAVYEMAEIRAKESGLI